MTAHLEPTLDVVDDLPGFERLRSEWDALAAGARDPNVFLTWDWLHTWWRHFGEGRTTARLHVVVLRGADGRLVAAAPLFRRRLGLGPLTVDIVRQISFDAGDYGGALLAPGADDAVPVLVHHLAELLDTGVHQVVLSRLPSDSAFLAALRRSKEPSARPGPDRPPAGLRIAETDLGDACPYADVRGGYDLARHLKKHKVRQRMRRLSERHDVAFTYHTGPTLDAGLDMLVELHRRRWDGRDDEFRGLLADPTREAFLLDAVRALDRRGHLRLLTLTADGAPVACEMDFAFGGRVYMFKGAFDPDFAEFSPGQLTHYRVFEDGIAAGVEEFDFLRGDHPYKRRWANADRRLVTVTLTRAGLTGKLARRRTQVVARLTRPRPPRPAAVRTAP